MLMGSPGEEPSASQPPVSPVFASIQQAAMQEGGGTAAWRVRMRVRVRQCRVKPTLLNNGRGAFVPPSPLPSPPSSLPHQHLLLFFFILRLLFHSLPFISPPLPAAPSYLHFQTILPVEKDSYIIPSVLLSHEPSFLQNLRYLNAFSYFFN